MKDPYSVLGVAKTASAEEIRKAYRRLAKQNHPDLHPGDKEAEASAVAVRERSGENRGPLPLDEFLRLAQGRIAAHE